MTPATACAMVALRRSLALSKSSSTPVTRTVCGTLQLFDANDSAAGDSVATACAELLGVTVTLPAGSLSRCTA